MSIVWLVILVVQGLLPAVSLYLTRWLVDSLVLAIEASGSWETLQPTLTAAGFMVGVMLLGQMLGIAGDWLNVAQAEYISDHINALIHKKSSEIDIVFFELPAYHDMLSRAKSEGSSRTLALLQDFGSMFRDIIAILGIGVILLSYGLWLPLLLLVSALPAFLTVLYFNRRVHRWWEQTTVDRRWAGYYDSILTTMGPARELRLFDLSPHFQTAYQNIRQHLRAERLSLARKQSLFRIVTQIFTLLFFGLIMAWMAWRALRGLGTLGDVALFFQAFNQGQSLLRSFLNSVSNIYNDLLFLSNLFSFLDLEPQILDPEQPQPAPLTLQKGICFQNLTFRYPGSDRLALQDFNLTIPAGQTVALVGANGAGKTTLLKLLCRFYDPEQGRITLDGVDLRNFTLAELHRLITVLFQDPVHFHATAGQNVALGDLSQPPDVSGIEAAARSAGAHEVIERLPEHYETLLGKAYTGGTELSGGEWQRVALARAFWRQAQIIVLDEPTSALDSWSEADWFDRFRRLARGRTAIIITHRLTIARRADLIHVMDAGRIVESGTHEELLAKGGFYRWSWAAQTQETGDLQPKRVIQDNGHLHDFRIDEPVHD